MEYKVGDKIKIFKPSKSDLKKWSNSWVEEMDNYIGKELILTEISRGNIYFENGGRWAFPPILLKIQQNQELNYEIY